MNTDYRFEVYTEYSGEGDKVFVASYYDLDTVIGVGDTVEDAIKEAEGNLEVFLEYCKENNIDVPSPSKHEDNEFSGKVTLRMSKSLHKKVDERAKQEGVSLNSFLNEAIITYLNSSVYEKVYINQLEYLMECLQSYFDVKKFDNGIKDKLDFSNGQKISLANFNC
ncbi:MAG: toxin-antitoxin system HicB family antitoxin [Acholeplasmatales bacterium]|nr:toxin-antitoxin system HicB family antitoxin [Acholeplasmatales bacterium]